MRLKHAYFITCQSAVKDAQGEVVELRCTYDPASRGGSAPGKPVFNRTVTLKDTWAKAEKQPQGKKR